MKTCKILLSLLFFTSLVLFLPLPALRRFSLMISKMERQTKLLSSPARTQSGLKKEGLSPRRRKVSGMFAMLSSSTESILKPSPSKPSLEWTNGNQAHTREAVFRFELIWREMGFVFYFSLDKSPFTFLNAPSNVVVNSPRFTGKADIIVDNLA